MPRKAYQADLKKAAAGVEIPGISHVRAGDDDGEFKVRITPPDKQPFEISALIPELGDYPSEHYYQIFVSDDDAPAWVGQTIENLPDTTGRNLDRLLEILSNTFVATDGDGDALMIDSQVEEASDDEDDFDAYDSDDDPFNIDGIPKPSLQSVSNSKSTFTSPSGSAKFRDRIRSDLNIAKAAGFKVGHYGGLLEGDSCYVIISCRVSKLGISEEAIEAWQLLGNEYLILLIHFPNGYRTTDDIEGYDPASARRNIEFRIGCSNTYKPTVQETIMAFAQLAGKQKQEGDTQSWVDPTTNGFREVFISKPLNQLFNERLPTILRYRLTGMPWTGAEKFYNDYQGKNTGVDGSDFLGPEYLMDDSVSKVLPTIVTADHLKDAPTPHSLPLLAGQFLLRHFVRCTEFCLVCHCKLDDDLEAIKPYVCDKPLCLYQYMSLGFGPSVEHEVMTQPYVVDLLISFCYSQATANKLKDFPTGLSLSLPSFQIAERGGPNASLTFSHTARYDASSGELIFEKGVSAPFKLGDWVMMQYPSGKETRVFHCRVTEMAYFPTVRLSAPIMPPPAQPTAVQTTNKSSNGSKNYSDVPLAAESGWQEINFNVYDVNFDNLSKPAQHEAIVKLLQLVPPVQELRDFLIKHPDRPLSGWLDRLPPAALGILRWIVASNRACIMQPSTSGKKGEYRVHGMKDYMQFRFAMGAPDKERRFIDAVQATSSRLSLTYPTLYAWHGSPLHNWHSIIREGLHFRETAHGRAFGNGVYHSLDFNTSSGYSGMYYYNYNTNSPEYTGGWPNSELKISSAMALNEIVNAPHEFVSRTPHLVVAQLDWIQTRFLFVKVSSEKKLAQDENSSVEFHVQDPTMTPRGQDGPVKIPIHATRAGRNTKTNGSLKSAPKITKHRGLFSKKGTAKDPIPIDDDDNSSVATDDEDRNILLDDDVQIVSSQTAQSQGAGKESSLMGGFKTMFGSGKAQAKPPKALTDFVPGQLDHDSLPILKEPQFATIGATKRLQKDFQSLVRLQQSTPLHELGWYTDPEKFDNVYQWIVELHSFEQSLPLAKQMKEKGIKSIVMEMRFGQDYPMTPPFIRVIRPRFRSFMAGGGGHVTAGGSLCMELLTNSGWSAVSSIESVLLQVRMAMSSTDPRPAQLEHGVARDYGVGEAVDAYVRACQAHGWRVPDKFREMAFGGAPAGPQY